VRTTLTLDEDVAAKLRTETRRTGRSFKEIVNAVLRRGLASQKQRGALPRFVVRARPLGLRPGLDYDKTSDLLEQIEGPLRR
jgi:plasmid stability protein